MNAATTLTLFAATINANSEATREQAAATPTQQEIALPTEMLSRVGGGVIVVSDF